MLVPVGVWITIVDLDVHRIPNPAVVAVGCVCLGHVAVDVLVTGAPAARLVGPALAAVLVAAMDATVAVPGWVGIGDVKLAAAITPALVWTRAVMQYPVIEPAGDPRRLVTRAQAAAMVGYSVASLATVMRRDPGAWPSPVGRWKRGRTWVLLWDLDQIVAAAPPATAVTRRLSMPTVSGDDGC